MNDKNNDCGYVAYADDYGELASFLEDAAEKLRTLDAIHRNASDAEAFSTLGGVANELVHDGKGDLAESIWSALDKIRAVRHTECQSATDVDRLREAAEILKVHGKWEVADDLEDISDLLDGADGPSTISKEEAHRRLGIPMRKHTEYQSMSGDGTGEALPDAANLEREAPAIECKSITADLSALSDEIDILESDDHPGYINEAAAKMREIAARLAREMECRSVSLTEEQIRRVAEHAAAIWPTQTVYGAVVDALRAMDCGSVASAKRAAHERHEAAVASVMFKDDSWAPDSESEQ